MSKFKKGGEWYTCKILARRLHGFRVLVRYKTQLDFGYPVFMEEEWVWKWNVKE